MAQGHSGIVCEEVKVDVDLDDAVCNFLQSDINTLSELQQEVADDLQKHPDLLGSTFQDANVDRSAITQVKMHSVVRLSTADRRTCQPYRFSRYYTRILNFGCFYRFSAIVRILISIRLTAGWKSPQHKTRSHTC